MGRRHVETGANTYCIIVYYKHHALHSTHYTPRTLHLPAVVKRPDSWCWNESPLLSDLVLSLYEAVFFSLCTWPQSSAEITFTEIEEIYNLFLYNCPTLNSFTASPHSQNSLYFTQLKGFVIKSLHVSSVHLHEARDKQSGQ